MFKSILGVVLVSLLAVFAGCDDGPNTSSAETVTGPRDPYAPVPMGGNKPRTATTGGSGAANNTAAVEAHLAQVEGKLDEALKLLYDSTVANDKRYAELKAQLHQLAAEHAAAPAAGTAPAPTGTAGTADLPPEQAPAPVATVAAPAWTAEQKQWIDKYESKFSGATPIATTEQTTDLIGAKLPQTRFLSAAGGVIDLNDYAKKKQKVVLVMLRGFAGSICLYCSAQTLALSRAEADFKKRDTQVVLVYPGKAESVPMFLEAISKLDPKTPLTFPVGMDVDLAAVHLFRIRGEIAKPTTLILDTEGVVRYAYVGANPTDRPTVKEMLAELDKQK